MFRSLPNSPCFSLTSILFVLLHMFCHEIHKLFLAGSCSERGRLGNTIFQRAAGHALESIDLAQIRFVFMLFLFLFFWHRPSLRKCDVFCCGFWLMPMDKYGQTVGNICAQRRVMPRKPEEVEEIQDFRGPLNTGLRLVEDIPELDLKHITLQQNFWPAFRQIM